MLRMAVRGLGRRPVRSALTVMGIGLGFATYLAIFTLAHAFRARFEAVLGSTGAEITVERAGIGLPFMSRLGPAELAGLAGLQDVDAVSGVVMQLARPRDGTQLVVFGVDMRGPLARIIEVTRGRAVRPGEDAMWAGEGAAARYRLEIGQKLTLLPGAAVPVAAIGRTGHGFLDRAVALDLPVAQRLFDLGDTVNLCFLKLKPGASAPGVIAEIQRRFPRVQANLSELYVASFNELGVVLRFADWLAGLGLLVCVLVVANTMAMTVSERVGELATLRAVGWGRPRIAGLLAIEGLCLTALGGGVGFLLTSAFVAAVSRANLLGAVETVVPLTAAAGGALLLLAAGLVGSGAGLAGVLRLKPAAALRT